MTETKPCPICGKSNNRQTWYDDYGLIEEHYWCDKCGYFFNFAYGETTEGIDLTSTDFDWAKAYKDAEKIVHCKDCKKYSNINYHTGTKFDFHFCNKFGNVTKENDFCSYGEQKEWVNQ